MKTLRSLLTRIPFSATARTTSSASQKGFTPLNLEEAGALNDAIKRGDTKQLEMAFQHPDSYAYVNIPFKELTPLQQAVDLGNLKMVNLLLKLSKDKGLVIDLLTQRGTAARIAFENKNAEILAALLKAGSEFDLHGAIEEERKEPSGGRAGTHLKDSKLETFLKSVEKFKDQKVEEITDPARINRLIAEVNGLPPSTSTSPTENKGVSPQGQGKGQEK